MYNEGEHSQSAFRLKTTPANVINCSSIWHANVDTPNN